MANNRNSIKGNDKEKRNAGNADETRLNKKLKDNPRNDHDESLSTAGDTSGGKYSKTTKRDEDIDNDDTRGGL